MDPTIPTSPSCPLAPERKSARCAAFERNGPGNPPFCQHWQGVKQCISPRENRIFLGCEGFRKAKVGGSSPSAGTIHPSEIKRFFRTEAHPSAVGKTMLWHSRMPR
ncbi:hypothetical protein MTBUT4_230018 [Magnetospirillum sp. UT-4]|nr:hypothetical protein MTBUT4_230018 [Magnetospirillum sp. UT-4]